MAWTHENHTTTFGAEIRRDRYDDAGSQVSNGFFTVNGFYSSSGFSDMLLGLPYETSATATLGVGQFRATSQAYYINDNWKVKPNLSIEMGLRYEYTPPWGAKNDSVANNHRALSGPGS
jgi:outer membrane receptor for ferrienterochelin and colicin